MFLRFTSLPFLAVLLVFIIRRILFTIAIFLPPHDARQNSRKAAKNGFQLPEALVLVPCRDEVEMIPGVCASISKLDYPAGRLRVVLISDGSRDGTLQKMEQEAVRREGWSVQAHLQNLGKAAALNAALSTCPFGEIIYVLDADHRPEPEALKNAAHYFADDDVAGVSGLTRVVNPTASSSAYYSTVESYVNQLVTMRAKDRLGLAPALLGSNCCYRRDSLDRVGGFRTGVLSEDSDMTVSLYRAGRRVRFAEDVVAYQQAPQTVKEYLKQHVRWGMGLNAVAKNHSLKILQDSRLSLPLRIELLLFSAGYLDRLALAGAGTLAVIAFVMKLDFRLQNLILLLYLFSPLLQIMAVFAKERAPLSMWRRLSVVPLYFLLDILAALQAVFLSLKRRTPTWSRTERIIVREEKV